MTVVLDYSIIIPAFNEEAYLPRTLSRIQKSMAALPQRGEVIVVDNNSTDSTPDVAADYGARVVFEGINQISRARNRGAGAAQGKYLVFLDADTDLDKELLAAALTRLESGEYCGGGARVKFRRPVAGAAGLFLRFWNWLAVRLDLAAGCFVFCLKEAFDAVGGFSEQVYASEEIWLSRALQGWGKKHHMRFVVLADHAIRTSTRKVEWYSQPRLVILFLPILLFPPLLRIQSFCSVWYKRP